MDAGDGNRVVEATAPACVDLAGGVVVLSGGAIAQTAAAVTIAIDRRALCRAETGMAGLAVDSRDTPFRFAGGAVGDLLAAGCEPLVPAVLRRLGIDSGLKITFQSRISAGTGLGDEALVVALSAALSVAALGEASPEAVLRVAQDVLSAPPRSPHRLRATIHGGVWTEEGLGAEGATRLDTDPGRVEESLLLVDSGVREFLGETDRRDAAVSGGGDETGDIAGLARAVGNALVNHRYGDVGPLVAREWDARKQVNPAIGTPEVERIAQIARAAGGAARTCSGGGGGWMLVWAPPGEIGEGSRERVERGLRESGFRAQAFRVDLRGLEVD